MLELLMDRICPSSKTINRLDVVLITHVSVFRPFSELNSAAFQVLFSILLFYPWWWIRSKAFTLKVSAASVECKAEVGLSSS